MAEQTTLERAIVPEGKVEISLLIFLETCATDLCGRVDTRHMNAEDFAIAERWTKAKFILFKRLPFWFMSRKPEHFSAPTHRVVLSARAWELAHQYRHERGLRGVRRLQVRLNLGNE